MSHSCRDSSTLRTGCKAIWHGITKNIVPMPDAHSKPFRYQVAPPGCGQARRASTGTMPSHAEPRRASPRQAAPASAASKQAPAPRPGSSAAQIHAQRARAITLHAHATPPPPRLTRPRAGPCTTTFQICSSFFYVSYIRLVICLCLWLVLVLCVGGV